jgi:hypothetical protein
MWSPDASVPSNGLKQYNPKSLRESTTAIVLAVRVALSVIRLADGIVSLTTQMLAFGRQIRVGARQN